MKYGIVCGAPATASVPGNESDEDTSNHSSSSSAKLYSVTTNCCSHTIIIICRKRKTRSICNPPSASFQGGRSSVTLDPAKGAAPTRRLQRGVAPTKRV